MSKNTYIESELKRIEQNADLKYLSVKEATTLAKNEVDIRLAGMNEFREALKDSNATFMTKTEFSIYHDKISEDVKSLRESRANTEGKATMTSVYISYIIAIIALTISIIRIFI